MVLIPLLLLLFLFIVGSRSKSRVGEGSRWGINLAPRSCPRCHTPLPAVRVPRNLRQVLWGGWTCRKCGLETDKQGKVVADHRAA